MDAISETKDERLSRRHLIAQIRREKAKRRRQKSNNKKYKREARARRLALVAAMGGKCVLCQATEDLEFDHPYGRDWVTRDFTQKQRIILYEKEWAAGLIRLLCGPCNKRNLPWKNVNALTPQEEKEPETIFNEC